MGFQSGDLLIPPNEANPNGFFERIDLISQNDYSMAKQNVHYYINTKFFDPLIGLKYILKYYHNGTFLSSGTILRKNVSTGYPWVVKDPAYYILSTLSFLNDPNNFPWIIKDPRLCITLAMWLPLIKFSPVILFTYRHPLDVALSMIGKEDSFILFNDISSCLKVWYIYNKRAIQQTNSLCRIVTSAARIVTHTKVELTRISREMHKNCGFKYTLNVTDNDFMNKSQSLIHGRLLFHHKLSIDNNLCSNKYNVSSRLPPSQVWNTSSIADITLFREVMRVFCAMEQRTIFQPGFEWDETLTDEYLPNNRYNLSSLLYPILN